MDAQTRPAPRAAAFFDVDGTLVDGTIVDYYVYFRKRLMSPWKRPLWITAYLLKCLYYLHVDRRDRMRFNRLFYRDYAQCSAPAVKALARGCFRDVIIPRLFAEASSCVSDHQGMGHLPVLVTGSLDFIMSPLAEFLGLKDMLCVSLIEKEDRFTGELREPPLCGDEKARRIRAFAAERNIDLSQSHAYGDSVADLPMLEAVGHPHVINPDRALAAIALARAWPSHAWSRKS
jgi:HAD superfamily hydrolase (TIGR01490 family)